MLCEMKELCLEITNRCPMNCLHCSGNWHIEPPADLNSDVVFEVVDDFISLGGELLEVSGGEPLLHDELYDILSYSKSKNLEVRLYTSGVRDDSWIDPPKANELKKTGTDKVIFNLEGATAETHDSITRRLGSFEKALNSIVNVKSFGMWAGIHFVPMKPNLHELKDFVKLCASLEVDEIGILRLVPQGNGKTHRAELELSKQEFVGLIQDIVDLREGFPEVTIRTGCPLNFVSLISRGPVEQCKVGRSTCVVKPNGDVVPCPAFKQDKTRVMGNILRAPFAEIWRNSSGWNEFRRFDYRQLDEPCSSCRHLRICAGRCIAQRILDSGDIYSAPDPMCPLIDTSQSMAWISASARRRQ